MAEPNLPHVLTVICEVAGEAAMLRIAQHYGGQKVKLPGSFERANWLTEMVGVDKARAIVKELGHGTIDIPLGPAGSYAAFRRQMNRRYGELREAGATAASIARELGITERAVRYRRHKDREQGDLFSDGPETLPGRE